MQGAFVDPDLADEVDDGKKYQDWVFTCNNYTVLDEANIANLHKAGWIKYVKYSREVAPTTGTKHLQGYLELYKKLPFKDVRGRLPRSRIAFRKGGQQQAIGYVLGDYTDKAGKYKPANPPEDIVTLGEPRVIKKRKEATDYKEVAVLTKAGDFNQIEEKYPRLMIYDEDIMRKRFKPTVDKTKLDIVYEEPTGDYYLKKLNNRWWDGYAHEKHVVLHYYDQKQKTYLEELLRELSLNRATQFEVKGKHVWVKPELVTIYCDDTDVDTYTYRSWFQ